MLVFIRNVIPKQMTTSATTEIFWRFVLHKEAHVGTIFKTYFLFMF